MPSVAPRRRLPTARVRPRVPCKLLRGRGGNTQRLRPSLGGKPRTRPSRALRPPRLPQLGRRDRSCFFECPPFSTVHFVSPRGARVLSAASAAGLAGLHSVITCTCACADCGHSTSNEASAMYELRGRSQFVAHICLFRFAISMPMGIQAYRKISNPRASLRSAVVREASGI